MKVHQIIGEKQLDEVPGANPLTRMVKKAGAKIAGAVGAKGIQGQVQGGLDADARGKELYTAWKTYAGQTGTDAKVPTKDQVADFMATQKMPTGRLNAIPDGSTLGKGEIDKVLQGAAQDSFKGKAGQAAVGKAPAAEKPPGEKWGTSPGAEQEPQPAGAGGGTIPKNLKQKIDALKPAQKQELIKLL